MLDVPAGQPNLTAADVGGPGNGPGNYEHMDYVAIERQIALDRLPIPRIPVTVVTARGGQSADPDEQKVWLDGSSDPVHVVLDGGHVIHEDDPEGVAA
jgi:pimeloyl-ACP methyl ester carboxylesterase